MSFIDLFAEEKHLSMHVQLTTRVLRGIRQRLSCLSANIVANSFNLGVNIQYAETCLWGSK